MAPLQCKDIPDAALLEAVRRAPSPGDCGWRMSWDVHDELEVAIGPVPIKLFRAKAAKLIARGLLGGCACGCRGDYHLPEECGGGETCCGPVDSEGSGRRAGMG